MSNLNTKFKVGDRVRISKMRDVFDKAYHLNWSATYLSSDVNNKEMLGCFY